MGGAVLRGPNITTVLPQFFDDNSTSIRPSTRKNWTSILCRLERRYPHRRLNELTSDDLRDFLVKDEHGRPAKIAPGTIVQRRACLRSFFGWCLFAGILVTDPSSVLNRTVRVKPQPVRPHTWLTEEEIAMLFDTCRREPNEIRGERDALVIGFGVYCGLRVHEIVKVKWGDLNLRAGTLTVMGKGGKLATVPIPPQFTEMLFEWQGVYAKGTGSPLQADQPVLVALVNGGGPEFGDTPRTLQPVWGKKIGESAAYKIVRTRGSEAGIPNLAPHDLRRSYAGILEDRGVDLRTISTVMRHSSIATTERYLADNPKKVQDSVSSALAGLGTRSA
jgi:integrase